jgi:hypothetical protein
MNNQEMLNRFLRNVLIGFIVFSMSGLYTFLAVYPIIRKGVYAFAFVSFGVYLILNLRKIPRVMTIAPYLVWVLFYLLWGTLASPAPEYIIGQVQTLIIRNLAFMMMIALAIVDRTDVNRLANYFQLAAVLNMLVSLWSTNDPDVMFALQGVNEDQSFDDLRPAGLWGNPNTAAYIWLFFTMMSYWASPGYRWSGRVAAVVGIFLSASRSGMYLLILCLLLMAFFSLRKLTYHPLHIAVIGFSTALLVGLFWTNAFAPSEVETDETTAWKINRLLDFKEENTTNKETRLDLAMLYYHRAMEAPWYGYGVFRFYGSGRYPLHLNTHNLGSHNSYLVVVGETGIFGCVVYIWCVAMGLRRLFLPGMVFQERFMFSLIWMVYLIFSMVRHTQFVSINSMFMSGIMYHVPIVLSLTGVSVSKVEQHDEKRLVAPGVA